jgi:hypothetical protein
VSLTVIVPAPIALRVVALWSPLSFSAIGIPPPEPGTDDVPTALPVEPAVEPPRLTPALFAL